MKTLAVASVRTARPATRSGALRRITQEDVSQLLQSGELHAFIDDIQLDLADIHDKVGSTWFAYEV